MVFFENGFVGPKYRIRIIGQTADGKFSLPFLSVFPGE